MRYQRQIILKGFGIEKQQLLQKSKVLVIGAGGLGCPVLMYLAAAGIGHLGIVDYDTVENTNLNRQILYTPNDVGLKKVMVSAKKIKAFNPEIEVEIYDSLLDNNLAWKLIQVYDVIVDCTDTFTTRYLINDACVLLNKPWVFGAIFSMQGQVAAFNVSGEKHKTNYRHFFAKPPLPDNIQNCETAGVLGTMPGIIGLMQAEQVIKICAQLPGVLHNRINYYNSVNNSWQLFELSEIPQINTPKSKEAFLNFNYGQFCNELIAPLITYDNLNLNQQTLIDVRNKNEKPYLNCKHFHIPLETLPEKLKSMKLNDIVFVCNTGMRSKQAAQLAVNLGINAFSLQNGLTFNQQLTITDGAQ
ncbi:MAG: HesA/MoeB/ThiF family protein [Bacteroidia bacterium]|nr:HesA/MoeB/ThiF family protein [Bacteroidia bacterium]